MGDARRRRLLTKPFSPVVVEPDQPGHFPRCLARKHPVDTATCECAVYGRLEARRRVATVVALAGALGVTP